MLQLHCIALHGRTFQCLGSFIAYSTNFRPYTITFSPNITHARGQMTDEADNFLFEVDHDVFEIFLPS